MSKNKFYNVSMLLPFEVAIEGTWERMKKRSAHPCKNEKAEKIFPTPLSSRGWVKIALL